MDVGLVVYEGVLYDECEAFRTVLGRLRGARIVNVGAEAGTVGGPGGTHLVDATFDTMGDPDVVVVPGGLGVDRASHSEQLLTWLRHVERRADYVLASSTGSIVVAAAGLLHGRPAATHWLAADLLQQYGSDRDAGRLAVAGNVITAEGSVSAVEAAFALIERIEGPQAAAEARATLIAQGGPHLRQPSRWQRWRAQWFARSTDVEDRATDAPEEAGAAGVTPRSVMIELVPVEDLAPVGRRSAARRTTRADRRRAE